jgi:hydroxypyruvate isomerase
MMNRREFAQRAAGATLAAALPVPALAAPSGSPAFGFSVMLWTVFRDLPFEQRLAKVAEAGYHSVQLVNEFDKWTPGDFRQFQRTKKSLAMTCDSTAGIHTGVADPAAGDKLIAELTNFFPIAAKLECPTIIVLSGNRIEGVSHEAQHQACIESLKRAADLAEKNNVTLLLENIDQEENPKYYLTSVAEGFEIIRAVDHPRVKFLYDFYHEQISEGNLIEKLEKNIGLVGVVHIADVPGRHQPGTGEINYESIFRKLAGLNFSGYAAMEFLPVGDPVLRLREAREMALRAAGEAAPAH